MNEEITGTPVHSLEAEMAVLYAMIMEPEKAIWTAMTDKRLQPAMFYRHHHQKICKAMFTMTEDGQQVDPVHLRDHLLSRKVLAESIAGKVLGSILENPGKIGYTQSYIDTIVEKFLWRSLLHEATALPAAASIAMEKGEVAEDFIKTVPERFVKVLDGLSIEPSNEEVLNNWYERMEAIKRGEIKSGLPLPWEKLHNALGGLRPGLILIGARPSAGKTTIEVNIIGHLVSQGIPVGRVCMDMSKEGLLARSVVHESRVSLPRLERGWAKWDHLETVREVKDVVKHWPIHVNSADTNVASICAWARMAKARYGIQVLTVDFAQLMDSGDGRMDANMNALMGLVTRKLKKLAFDLDIPVILLSQLSRSSDKEDRPPKLSDLRDSGNLEQNATQVILLSKARAKDYPTAADEAYPGTTDFVLPEDAERGYLRGLIVDVAKNQNGGTGKICMYLRPNYFRIEDAEPEFIDIDSKLYEYRADYNENETGRGLEIVCDGDEEEEVGNESG